MFVCEKYLYASEQGAFEGRDHDADSSCRVVEVDIHDTSKLAELAATVPAVAAANNRSDEIAFLEKILADCDRMLDNKDRYLNLIVWINDRIAQLRAMR